MLEAYILIVPVLGLTVVVAIAASGATGGYLFSLKAVMPKASKLNPAAGLKRMFGVKALVELGKALLKFFLVTGVLVYVLNDNIDTLNLIGKMALEPALALEPAVGLAVELEGVCTPQASRAGGGIGGPHAPVPPPAGSEPDRAWNGTGRTTPTFDEPKRSGRRTPRGPTPEEGSPPRCVANLLRPRRGIAFKQQLRRADNSIGTHTAPTRHPHGTHTAPTRHTPDLPPIQPPHTDSEHPHMSPRPRRGTNHTASADATAPTARTEAVRNTTRISINLVPSLAVLWLMPRLGSFYDKHPLVDVNIVTSLEPLGFRSGPMDMEIRYEPISALAPSST
eukprot:gene46181-61757_t